MHELGIVFEIQKRVTAVAEENGLSLRDIAQVVVEVGEASTIVPRYLKECWPAATDGTEMENNGVYLEVIPGEKLVFTDAYTEVARRLGLMPANTTSLTKPTLIN